MKYLMEKYNKMPLNNIKDKLSKLVKTLSIIPCYIGFHNYEQTGKGFIYSSYKCGKCGFEDIDAN